jgi:hypothetical protein
LRIRIELHPRPASTAVRTLVLEAKTAFVPFENIIEPTLTRSLLLRHSRETLNDFNELVVRDVTGVVKFVDLMFIRKPAQAH